MDHSIDSQRSHLVGRRQPREVRLRPQVHRFLYFCALRLLHFLAHFLGLPPEYQWEKKTWRAPQHNTQQGTQEVGDPQVYSLLCLQPFLTRLLYSNIVSSMYISLVAG